MMPNPQMHYDLVKARERELLQEAARVRLAKAARAERPHCSTPALRRLGYTWVTVVLWLKTLW